MHGVHLHSAAAPDRNDRRRVANGLDPLCTTSWTLNKRTEQEVCVIELLSGTCWGRRQFDAETALIGTQN